MWAIATFIRYFNYLFLILLFSAVANGQVYRPGEVIVKLKGDTKSVTATSFLGKVQLENQMKLQGSWSGLNMHHFKSTAGHTTQQLMEIYRNDPVVQYVEPNYVYKKLDVEGSAANVHGLGGVSTSA